MRLSEHFRRAEFRCKCGRCGFDTVDAQLLKVLDQVRLRFGAPVVITSGCRCPEHNARVGGSKGSQHLYGRAADFVVRGVEPAEVYRFLIDTYPDRYGFGLYSGWVHCDTRSNGPARWES